MAKSGCPAGYVEQSGTCKKVEIFDVIHALQKDPTVKQKLCNIPHMYGLGIGGGLADRGHTSNDIDIILKFLQSFKKLTREQQEDIYYKACAATPERMFGLIVDKGFFDIVDDHGFTTDFGTYDDHECTVMYAPYIQEIFEEDPAKAGRHDTPDTVESIDVILCTK